jgi:hypothetical protein
VTAEPIAQDHAYVDAEELVRQAFRASPRLTMLGGRVFFGIPTDTSYPIATVSRIGGAPRGAVDSARLSAQAMGSTKKSAADVAKGIAAAVEDMGGTVDSVLWLPLPPDGSPRYVIDFSLDIVATATA